MLYDKAELYSKINLALAERGINSFGKSLNLQKAIKTCEIELSFSSFKSNAIGALLIKGDKKSGILVNSDRPLYDQNFDLAHEFVHFLLHPSATEFGFTTMVKDKQREWEANEGAAELLLPYKDFIPRFVTLAYFSQKDRQPFMFTREHLSKFYNVNFDVVDYRIHNLSKEISQYLDGSEIADIKLMQSEKLLQRADKKISALNLTTKIFNGQELIG